MEGDRPAARRRTTGEHLGIALGAALVVAGVAFHVLAATVHPAVEPRPAGADVWVFLQWGWLRVLAWAGVAGGTWLAAWCLTRGRPAAEEDRGLTSAGGAGA